MRRSVLKARITRSAGVALAAGVIGMGVMTTPAQAAAGSCYRDSICVWSKENFKGRYGRVEAQARHCTSSRSVGARSINNNTRFMLNMYSKTNCKGRVFSLNWGTKMKDGFPFPVKSFKTM
ncbi:peptidase inhibitor family I36 protein [Streptomyces sp. I05A-00742]|uniref:peptidase inhibitor family I36 protein n=1 Tax=Streptomyces sp. I05A-00742 TaxID=2732853 RepID=UPI0014898FB4|nr:peptidase inhibitor family I36 protein [Streptomyces sp. I05A-00742]